MKQFAVSDISLTTNTSKTTNITNIITTNDKTDENKKEDNTSVVSELSAASLENDEDLNG